MVVVAVIAKVVVAIIVVVVIAVVIIVVVFRARVPHYYRDVAGSVMDCNLQARLTLLCN